MTSSRLFSFGMVALVAICSACTRDTSKSDAQDPNLYSHLGSDFKLTDHEGQRFVLSERAGVSLLVFGFTSCPDICPLTMSRLSSVMGKLQREDVTVLFVSVDPHRDTPERLREYIQDYDFPLVGLTSQDSGPITTVARSFAAGLGRTSDGAIDHSSRIYLLDSADRVCDVFGSDDEIDHMVDVIDHVENGPPSL